MNNNPITENQHKILFGLAKLLGTDGFAEAFLKCQAEALLKRPVTELSELSEDEAAYLTTHIIRFRHQFDLQDLT